jgi:hypothetical protein
MRSENDQYPLNVSKNRSRFFCGACTLVVGEDTPLFGGCASVLFTSLFLLRACGGGLVGAIDSYDATTIPLLFTDVATIG